MGWSKKQREIGMVLYRKDGMGKRSKNVGIKCRTKKSRWMGQNIVIKRKKGHLGKEKRETKINIE